MGTRSLRILHVAPYASDAWAYGGIPRLVGSLTRGLARRGHHVTLCTTDVCDEAMRLQNREAMGNWVAPWPPLRTADNVEWRVFRNASNRMAYHLQLFLPFGLNKYLSEHAGGFDVAHLHACRNVPGAMAAYHLQRSGVPYILAPNGTAPRIERRRFAKRLFDAVMGRRILSRASRVLAVSAAEQRQLRDLGIDPAVLRLIPNPIDLEEFSSLPRRGSFRRRFGIADRPTGRVVMFLGKLTPRKRVDALARAFAALDRTDARLVIAGNDMGSGTITRALVRSLGIEGRTIFTGLLCGAERLAALVDADVVVYPSEHEVFGLVALEALLSGTPVIVAGDSGCGEIVRRTGGGHVVPAGDVEALADAIRAVLDGGSSGNPAEVAQRINAAYSPDVVCDQLERVYGELIGGA